MVTVVCYENKDGFRIFLKVLSLPSLSLLPPFKSYDLLSGDKSRQSFHSSFSQHSPNMYSCPGLPQLKGIRPSLRSRTNRMNLEPQVFCLLCLVE